MLFSYQKKLSKKNLATILLSLTPFWAFAGPPIPGASGGGGFSSESIIVNERVYKNVLNKHFDEVDPSTGNLKIKHLDLRIPGDGGMDLNIYRIYDMHSTSASLYHSHNLSYRWTQLGPGWTMSVAPRIVANNIYMRSEIDVKYIWEKEAKHFQKFCEGDSLVGNMRLEFPDGGHEEIYTLGNRRAITKGAWEVRCANYIMSARSPDGLTYNFGDVRNNRRWLEFYTYHDPGVVFNLSESVLPAVMATDILGNWIKYEYIDFGPKINGPRGAVTPITVAEDYWERSSLLPAKITTSDGRLVMFSYDSSTGRLREMKDGSGRTWRYEYLVPDKMNARSLAKVILPTGEEWKYNYIPGVLGAGIRDQKFYPQNAVARKISTITYPGGGSVNYSYFPYVVQAKVSKTTYQHLETRVSSRVLSTGETWKYSYFHGGAGQLNVTKIETPDGVWTY